MKKKEKHLKIGTLSIILVILVGFFGTWLFRACFILLQKYEVLTKEQAIYDQCVEKANVILNSSDELTTQGTHFVYTGEGIYLTRYFHEINSGKREEAAKFILDNTENPKWILSAIEESKKLEEMEFRAIKLVCIARRYNEESIPQPIRDFELNEAEKKLSPSQKNAYAMNLLIGKKYEISKFKVRYEVSQYFDETLKEKATILSDSVNDVKNLIYQLMQYVLIIFIIVLGFMLYYHFQISQVVKSYVNAIIHGKELESKGVYELRYLADVYNQNDKHLQNVIREATQASDAKTQFISSMSHDIRTPMNAIIGMTQIAIRQNQDPDKVLDCLKKIEQASEHLKTLVNDVLDISAIESGKLVFTMQKISVHDTVDQVIMVMRDLINEKNLHFQYLPHHISQDALIADGLRIKQVYLNLLSNAVKYTEPGGNITLEIWQEDAEEEGKIKLCMSVKDSGIGMSAEFMQSMYTKFTRAIDTRVNKIEGTGLGLTISKAVVDAAGGTIDVYSELGKGTKFTVKMDVAIDSEQKEEQEIVQRNPESRSDLTILVAEDNDLNYEIVEDMLMMWGMKVVRAEDGESVYSFLHQPNLEHMI